MDGTVLGMAVRDLLKIYAIDYAKLKLISVN